MRGRSSQAAFAVLLLMVALPEGGAAHGCRKPNQIIESYRFAAEPIYAEVPQKVWWNRAFRRTSTTSARCARSTICATRD